MKHKSVRSRKLRRSYTEALLLTIFFAIVIRLFVISPYKIPTNTMNPALLSGDYVFVYKLPYGLSIPFFKKIGEIKKPSYGDIVLFSYPKKPGTKFIKRIVGLPGDRIEYRNKELYINNKKLEYEELESSSFNHIKNYYNLEFKTEKQGSSMYQVVHNKDQLSEHLAPILVPPGEAFLLGDHRDNSDDSRYWGTIPLKNLDGTVKFIWFSMDLETLRVRWERLFQTVK